MYKRTGWIQISPAACGRRVFVQAMHYPYVAILRQQKTYLIHQLVRQLDGLSARSHDGAAVNLAGTVRHKELFDGTKIEYYMDKGDTLIKSITLANRAAEVSGLRQVKAEEAGWVTKPQLVQKMDTEHTWPIDLNAKQDAAHFAALAGVYDDPASAGELLGEHVTGAYGRDLHQFNPERPVQVRGNHFSMLYLQPGDHHSRVGEKLMQTIIKQNAQSGARVHTVVQGVAAKTFVNMANKMVSQDREAMKTQQFYFSNIEGVGEAAVKGACQKLGATYAGTRVNPYDLRQRGRNAAAELHALDSGFRKVHHCVKAASDAVFLSAKLSGKSAKTIGAGAGAAAVALGVAGDAFKFTEAMKSIDNVGHVVTLLGSQSPYGLAALCGLGALVIYGQGRSMHKHYINKYKDLKALKNSTFGQANQIWFESQDQFRGLV